LFLFCLFFVLCGKIRCARVGPFGRQPGEPQMRTLRAVKSQSDSDPVAGLRGTLPGPAPGDRATLAIGRGGAFVSSAQALGSTRKTGISVRSPLRSCRNVNGQARSPSGQRTCRFQHARGRVSPVRHGIAGGIR
jgi:hypothetical protein